MAGARRWPARVGLMTVTDTEIDILAPRPREAAMLRVAGALTRAHALALASPGGGHGSVADILDATGARAAPGMAVRLATGLDQPGADFGSAAAALMRKCPLEVLLVQDAVETAPPRGRFAVRIAGRLSRGRFGAPASTDLLATHAIPARIVHAGHSPDWQAA